MIRKLLFDADGTLWNFDASAIFSIESIFIKHGWTFTPQVFDRYNVINNGLWERYERGEMERDRVLVERFDILLGELGIPFKGTDFEDEFRVMLEENPFWMDGAQEILEMLRPDYELFIVTNGVASTQKKRTALTGLDRYVDGIFISEEIGAQKPQPEFFDRVFLKIGSPAKDEVLLIGDSLSADIRGANLYGIQSVWFNPAGKPGSDIALPDHEIRSLSELQNILQ